MREQTRREKIWSREQEFVDDKGLLALWEGGDDAVLGSRGRGQRKDERGARTGEAGEALAVGQGTRRLKR